MLRSIIGRLTGGGGRRRPAAGPRGTAGPAGGVAGGSANRDIEQGAKSLIRGLSRKRRR